MKQLFKSAINLRVKLDMDEIMENTMATGHAHQLIHIDPTNEKKKRRCILCSNRTVWRCQGRYNRVKMDGYVVLCSAASGNPCNTDFT